VDDIVNDAEAAIFGVTDQSVNKSFHTLNELVLGSIDALEERQGNKSMLTGVPSGFTRLDQMTSGFQNSDLIILAARPAMGKTSLALNIARNAAVDHHTPVAIFSLEMS
jgi:replicative DNA helicase